MPRPNSKSPWRNEKCYVKIYNSNPIILLSLKGELFITMNELCKDLEQNQKFLELIEDIKNNTSPITISGLSDVGEAQFISAIKDETKKNICIITYNELQAKRIARDLKYFYDNVEIFPKREIATYDYLVESKDLPYERIDVLNKIITNKVNIVVTTIEAVMQKMIAKKTLYKNILKLKVGSECKLEDLKKELGENSRSKSAKLRVFEKIDV